MKAAVLSLCALTLAACTMFSVSFSDNGSVHRYERSSPIYTKSRLLGGAERPQDGGDECIPLPLTEGEFESIRALLEGDTDSIEVIGRQSLYQLMDAVERLRLTEDGMTAGYKNLARVSLGMIDINDILTSKAVAPATLRILPASFLFLLRGYASLHDTCICVEGGVATVCLPGDRRYGDTDQVSPVSAVRVLPSAFEQLVGGQGHSMHPTLAAAGTSTGPGGRKADSWDAVIWILRHMGILKLDLGGCKMSADHVLSLGNLSGLETLSLNHCGLRPNDLQSVVALTHLEELDVGGAGLGADDILTIASFVDLRVLSMEKCHLGSTDLTPIGALQRLVDLNVRASNLSDGNIAAIASLRRLTRLDMHGCYLGLVSLAPIRGLGSLVELSVGYSGLSIGNFEVITSLTGLIRLYMPGCDFHTGDLAVICKQEDLDRATGLGKPVGPSEAVSLDRLAELRSLEELDVSQLRLSRANAKIILSLNKLKKLKMQECGLQRGYLMGICGLEHLVELDVAHGDLSSGDVQEILSRRGLRKLNMSKCTLEPGCFLGNRRLGDLDGLEELNVGHVALSPAVVQEVLSLKKLKGLNMEKCGLQQGCLVGIRGLGSMEELIVTNNNLSTGDAYGITLLTKLKRLYISHCHLKQGCLVSIGNLVLLEELDAGSNELGMKDVEAILSLVKLRKLLLANCRIRGGYLTTIGGLKYLEELGLGDNQLSSIDILPISSLINLRKLDVCNGVLFIASIAPFKRLRYLAELNASRIPINKEEVSAISTLRYLVKLYLWRCKLTLAEIEPLGSLQNLEVLNLSGNGLSKEEVLKIVAATNLTV